ncbi:MAG: proteasome-type protease [Cyanobacteria bacterium P01_A01_bin.37]
MTYCLGIITCAGLVFAADSRTNAGVEYISTYQKLFEFSKPGERVLLLCTSGNLSITQGVIRSLRRDLKTEEESNLYTLSTMYDVVRYVGDTMRTIQDRDRPWLEKDNIDASCNFLVGGQLPGESPELYLIYPQGNFIQATEEMPFLQIGETKYGKPILDRTITFDTNLSAVAKCALLSIDSTMKSNISVGPPIDITMYEVDSFELRHHLRLPLGDPYLAKIRKLWETSVRRAFEEMPNVEWEYRRDFTIDDVFTD